MVDYTKIIVGVVLFFLLVFIAYLVFAPETPSANQKNNANYFTSSICCGGTFIMVILLLLSSTVEGKPKKISALKALRELTEDEKARFKVKNPSEMHIIDIEPIGDGKQKYVEYEINDPLSDFNGRIARITLNCMSDFKYSATDVPSETRVEGWVIKPMSKAHAKSHLASKTTTVVDKVVSAAKAIQKVDKKGGPTASELTEELAQKEEDRYKEDEEE